jgi:hypothetical protein
MTHQKCNKCGDPKPLDEFYRHNRCASGYGKTCKVCCSEQYKGRREANLPKKCKCGREKTRRFRPHAYFPNKLTGYWVCLRCKTEQSRKQKGLDSDKRTTPDPEEHDIAMEAALLKIEFLRSEGVKFHDRQLVTRRHWERLAEEARKGARA